MNECIEIGVVNDTKMKTRRDLRIEERFLQDM